MKTRTVKIIRNQWPTYTFLIFLTLVIWFGLPQLGIAPPISNRFYLTAAVYLLWILKLVFFDLSPSITISSTNTQEQQKQINVLEGRLNGILGFLHKTPMIYHKLRARFSILPWHLLIGPKSAGKTALLAHSGMRFVLSKKISKEALIELAPSETSEWWVTRSLVLVDTPGNWSLWENFIHLLQKKLVKPQGVILTLNLPEWMQTPNNAAWIQELNVLKKQIKNLRQAFGHHLNFHLVITKCDQLPGFREFFRDSSREDLTSAWGTPLPERLAKESLADVIHKRFNALIKQLNQQLVLRLHQERDSRLRPLIKDFPLEIEKLRSYIIQSINTVAKDLELKGIWLTSATQDPCNNANQDIEATTTQISAHLPGLLKPAAYPEKSYFIRHFLQHALPAWKGVQSKKQKHKATIRRTIYAFCIGIIITAAVIFGKDFYLGTARLQQLQAGIAEFKQTQKQSSNLPTLNETLKLLSTLQVADTHNNLTLIQRLPYFYSNKAYLNASKFYQEALKTLFLPTLSKALDEWLGKIKHETPKGQLYQVLEARLMLAGKIAINPKQIKQALLTTGNLAANKDANKELQTLITAIEKQHLIQTINAKLLKKARRTLTHMPAYKLGMLLLENNTASITNNAETILQVPLLFTQQRYDEVINTDIPTAAFETLHGNAILGKIRHHRRNRNQPSKTLISQLRNRYKQNYIKAWVARLHQLKMPSPIDLFATDTIITEIANETSPIVQQLHAIYDNTAFTPIISMHPSIAAIDKLFADTTNNNLWQQNTELLNKLHYNIENILTARDPSQSAFQLVMQSVREPKNNTFIQLNQLATENPEPIKTWLKTLARSSWQQVVNTSGAPSNNSSLKTTFDNPKKFISRIKKPSLAATQHKKKLTVKGLARLAAHKKTPFKIDLNLPKTNDMLRMRGIDGIL